MAEGIGRVLGGGVHLLLLLAACALPPGPQEQIRSTTSDYLQRLRWHDYHGVARYLAEENREGFLERFLPLSDLHITDVRLDHIDLQEKDRMVTHIVMEYYLLPSATVKTVALRQEWVHDRSRGWQTVTAFPPLD